MPRLPTFEPTKLGAEDVLHPSFIKNEIERPRKRRRKRPPTPCQERWLIEMERRGLVLVKTLSVESGPSYTLEPGGFDPPNLRTIRCLIRDMRLVPQEDGLIEGSSQSYRVASW